VIGGFDVQGRAVEKVNWHLGLDWLLLDLLLMAIIFIPIEMIFPKREEQDRFHAEWRTDLIYFAISHLCIQFFGVITQEPAVVFFGKMNLEAFQLWIQSLPLALENILSFFHHRCFSILGASHISFKFLFMAFSCSTSFNKNNGLVSGFTHSFY
jgi:lathosterol oxidase